MREARIRESITIEAALCAVLLLGLLAVAIATLHGTADAAAGGDLTMPMLGGTVRQELQNQDIVDVEHAAWATSGDSVSTDTITFRPASAALASVRPGGFLGDEVAAWNRSQRRDAWQSFLGAPPAGAEPAHSRLLTAGPVTDALGHRDVVVDPTALAVPSPFAERAWRPVVARDTRAYNGFVRFADVLEPIDTAHLPRPEVRPRGYCAAVSRPVRRSTDIYCGSFTGLERGDNAVLRFSSFQPDVPLRSGSVTRGVRHLWVDGLESRSVVSAVSPGALLFTTPTGTLIETLLVSGVIAGKSIVNGQQRFELVSGPLRSLAVTLARGRASVDATDTTHLALHNGLSRALDSAMTEFLRRDHTVGRLEAVVMDAWSGGVRASAGRTRFGPLEYIPGFEPSYIGSIVKPILAVAILSQQPDLANITVNAAAGEAVSAVRGVAVTPFFAGPGGRFDLADFLRYSSNKFAAELVFASLIESGHGALTRDARGDVALTLLERSDLANGLFEVFGVQAGGDKSGGRTDSVWVDGSGEVIPAMRDQSWYWPWYSRPSLFVFRAGKNGTPDLLRGASPTEISRYSYGQGFNEWSLLGTAQAFGRVVTGRRIVASMLDRQGGPGPSTMRWRNEPWAARVRSGLRGVVENGTATGLEPEIRRAFGKNAVVVYGKTGTAFLNDLDARSDRSALALLISPDDGRQSVPDCGIVVALAADYVHGRPLNGEAHLEFARTVVAPLLARYWKGLLTCHG